MGDAADDADSVAVLRARRGAGRRRRTRACPRRAARTRARAGGRSCAPMRPPRQRNAVPSPAQPTSRSSRLGVSRREALEVDAAVDDLGLAAASGHGRLELVAQPARDGDDGRRAPHDVTCRGANARDRADVRDVLPVRGDDERSARRERGREAGRDEEVRVDDVGMEAPALRAWRRGRERGGGASRRRASRRPRARSRGRARRARARGWRRRPRGPGRSGPGTSVRREGSAGRACATRASPAGSRGTSRRSSPRPRGCSAASSARRGRRACRLRTSCRQVTRTTSPGSALTGSASV